MATSAILRSIKNLSIKDWILVGGFTIMTTAQATSAYWSLQKGMEMNTKSILIVESRLIHENTLILDRLDNVEDNLRDDIRELRSTVMSKD